MELKALGGNDASPEGLRILVVNWLDRENPMAGGAEAHLHQIFGRLASWGHSVTLLCSGWKGAESTTELDGIEVVRSGSRYTFNLTVPFAAKRLCDERGFDVIVEDLNKVPVFTPTWGCDGRRVLLVHHLFGTTAFQEANPILAAVTWLLERTIPKTYAFVPCIAVSESTRSDLVERGLRKSSIRVITNGVDIEEFATSSERFSEPTLLYLGRLKRYKRVELILSTVALLRDRGLDVQCIIAGRGDDEGRLKALTKSLQIEGRVRFAGFVSDAERSVLFSRAWVHMLTSPKEGWGISVLEAGAAGTTTIASDSPGLRDAVRHGDTGILVPHGDVDGLAEAVEELMDRQRVDEMGRRAHRHALTFSWDRVAKEMESALSQVSAGLADDWGH